MCNFIKTVYVLHLGNIARADQLFALHFFWPNIYIYIYREREREREMHTFRNSEHFHLYSFVLEVTCVSDLTAIED